MIGFIGGRTRTRTWDPLIKSPCGCVDSAPNFFKPDHKARVTAPSVTADFQTSASVKTILKHGHDAAAFSGSRAMPNTRLESARAATNHAYKRLTKICRRHVRARDHARLAALRMRARATSPAENEIPASAGGGRGGPFRRIVESSEGHPGKGHPSNAEFHRLTRIIYDV